MESLREIFGGDPIHNEDGTYSPSTTAMKIAVPAKSDYDEVEYSKPYTGNDKKVLYICTEASTLECANGKVFKTGDHPSEMFIMSLHLEKAGFSVDFATPTGAPVAIEMFAVPQGDDVVSGEMARHQAALDSPLKMSDVLAGLGDDSPYVAVYLPGGHGATQGVPFDKNVGRVLKWFIDNDKYIITICHGPAILQSLQLDQEPDPATFPLAGYEMAVFTDIGDRLLTTVGYIPGEMPYFFGERIKALGVTIVNHLPLGGVHRDRKVFSGDSPNAADKLGRMVAKELLSAVSA